MIRPDNQWQGIFMLYAHHSGFALCLVPVSLYGKFCFFALLSEKRTPFCLFSKTHA